MDVHDVSEKRRERHKRKRHKKEDTSRKRERRDQDTESGRLKKLSQLAKLVQSGDLAVPQSLTHYKEEPVTLLDQVFTILSDTDVLGMLPDILKGLKIQQIKELCLKELKSLSTEELEHIINGDTYSTSESGECEGEEVPPSEGGESDRVSDNNLYQKTELVYHISDVSNDETSPSSPMGPSHDLTDRPSDSSHYIADRLPDKSHDLADVLPNKSHDLTDRSLAKSHDRSLDKLTNRSHDLEDRSRDNPHEIIANNNPLIIVGDNMEDHIELTASPDHSLWADDDLIDQQKILEMELRKRLLEKQLRQLDNSVFTESSDDAVAGQTCIENLSNVLETQLRQRALQSMLTKKQQNH